MSAPATLPTAGAVWGTTFEAIGTTIRLHVTDLTALAEATAVAKAHLAELDAAASRFRPDSEVSRLAARAEHGPTWAFASPLLADYVAAALHAARITDGLCDPTVGTAVVASGYDADIDVVRDRTGAGQAAPARGAAAAPGWQQVDLDPQTNKLSIPQGCLLDVGATAKGHGADTIAALLAQQLPGGFLVNLGGDIATSGTLPAGGWRIGVEDRDGTVLQVVELTGQAIATSSTRHRTWAGADGETRHHIVDPRTGRTAPATWAQVSCVAANALEANAASTSAVVLGPDAPAWLTRHGIPARLDHLDGTVTTTPGWPDPHRLSGDLS